MHFKFLSLAALAAIATAAPTTAAEQKKFGVAFKVLNGETIITANAMRDHSTGQIILVGERPSVYPGTPAYFTGNTGKGTANLHFDLCDSPDKSIHGGVYNAIVQNVGDNYGYAAPITLQEKTVDNGWGLSKDGQIFHKLFAATNNFFACTEKINGVESTVLKFGVYQSNGKAPENCESTTVLRGNEF